MAQSQQIHCKAKGWGITKITVKPGPTRVSPRPGAHGETIWAPVGLSHLPPMSLSHEARVSTPRAAPLGAWSFVVQNYPTSWGAQSPGISGATEALPSWLVHSLLSISTEGFWLCWLLPNLLSFTLKPWDHSSLLLYSTCPQKPVWETIPSYGVSSNGGQFLFYLLHSEDSLWIPTWPNLRKHSPVALWQQEILPQHSLFSYCISTHLQNICGFMSGSLPWTRSRPHS